MASKEDMLSEIYGVINSISQSAGISVRKTTGKKITVDCAGNRADARDDLQKALSKSGISNKTEVVTGSSELGTHLDSGFQIIYKKKPGSGGIGDTTLNSTITELFPCIAFLTEIKDRDPDTFYQKIVMNNSKDLPCYLSGDYDSGKKFIDDAVNSTKFNEKTRNAIAILKWINFQNSGKPIKNTVWGYRLKPSGIPSNHPGDIFIQYRDNMWIGVSLKAGGEKTQEPKLNTYVGKILKDTGSDSLYEKWKKESYDKFYKKIPNIPDYREYGKRPFLQALIKFEQSDQKSYDMLYDDMLEWLRDKLIDYLNANEKRTKQWMFEKIVGDDSKLGGVPLVVLKAFGDEVKELEDDDVVEACLGRVKSSGGIKVSKSPSSKQNFNISLSCNAKTTVLNFSIRTNKAGFEHKLGQYINLAVKFNGVQK